MKLAKARYSILILIVGRALAQPAAPVTAANLPPGMDIVIRDLDRTAAEAIRNPNDIGYTLGVVTRDGLAWTKSYGWTGSDRRSSASADTVYGIGTGAFTAIMLLQLVHEGKVNFSDPVEKYVPEIRRMQSQYPGAAPLTLLQLAVHTSGLTLGSSDVAAFSKGPIAEWEKTLIAALRHVSYEFEPGTHAALSNISDSILALALSRAARQPYTEYLKQKILLPLAMTHSDFSIPSTADADVGYQPALFTTIGDLARFAAFEMLAGPEVVLPTKALEENYRRMWVVNSIAVPNPSEGFGIGFEGETWTSNHYYFIPLIGYGRPGFDASFWFEPRRHAGVILLHQGRGGALGQMIHTYVYTLNAQKNDAGRQDPVKPLPYTEEEVVFDNKPAEIKLAGTLTVPQGNGPFPAVVLIPKSGPLDRDERMLNHRPFLILSDYLTRAGIVVLRSDVRGVGKSGGKFATQTDDYASDAEAAVAYLKTRPEVDPHRIGLVSHGEGGLAAPLVATRNRAVAFVVMLGAPAIPAAWNLVERTRLNSEANGEIYRKAEEQAAETRQLFSMLQSEEESASLEKKLKEFLAGKLPEEQVEAQIRQWTSPAFRRMLTYDPADVLKKLSCPVLALYAGKDLSVPAGLNLPAMRAALAASGNKNFEVDELEDLNFLFQTADVGIGREANWTEETISPVVLKKIADWLSRQGN